MKKWKKKLGCLVAFWVLSVLPMWGQCQGEEQKDQLELYSKSAVLIDGESRRVLYGKEELQKLPMASTTKIMTCILALEYGNEEDEVTVSEYAASMPKVHLGMRPGERYRLRDLLYSMMLESHNDSAVAIAEHISGSVPAFGELMNEKAKELGCKDTCFLTPNGLDSRENGRVHSTTAYDLACILAYCVQDSPCRQRFLAITGTGSYNFSCLSAGERTFSCQNHNAFLNQMKEALCGKTGFTGDAGYCYVGAVKCGDRLFVAALLGCGWPNHKSYKWSDMRKLVEYGKDHFTRFVLSDLKPDSRIYTPVIIRDGQSPELGKDPAAQVEILGQSGIQGILLREGEALTPRYQLSTELEAPVHRGQLTGTVDYVLDHRVYRRFCICLTEDIPRINSSWIARQIFRNFLFNR